MNDENCLRRIPHPVAITEKGYGHITIHYIVSIN